MRRQRERGGSQIRRGRWAAYRAAPPSRLDEFLARPGSRLPPSASIDRAVAEIVALHGATGGATFNRYFGSLAGQRLYAVAIFPELTRLHYGPELPTAAVRAFVIQQWDWLQDPRNNVGTWHDPETGVSFLDVTTTLVDRAQAVELGRRYNQISVFDLMAMEVIDVGGSGEALEGLPPLSERLVPWRRHRRAPR